MRKYAYGLAGLAFVTAAVLASEMAEAAEGGSSIYLLGSSGPAAAIMPPLPGVYFQNDFYVYQGSASAGRTFPLGGNVVGKLDATAIIDLPTFIFVPSTDFLGGTLGFSATFPIGGPSVTAGAVLTGPLGNSFGTKRHDSITTFGDPYLSGFIGWQTGNFHWQTGVSVNVPIGDYREGALANTAFHRWMGDVFGAGTWLDPAIGLDISGKVGFSFNGDNPATDYRTGNEFHAEWAVEQHFSKSFSAGLVGYYYQQVTGDSGAGATLGPFEGRAVAVGATMAYNFEVSKIPVSARIKVYREFDVTKRLEGTAGIFTLSMPLYVRQ